MGHITADEARALTAKSDPDWHVSQILEEVKKAAAKGESTLKTYACDFGSGNCYSGKFTDLQKSVWDKLRNLGFATSIEVQEKQFVDIWLQVSWKE